MEHVTGMIFKKVTKVKYNFLQIDKKFNFNFKLCINLHLWCNMRNKNKYNKLIYCIFLCCMYNFTNSDTIKILRNSKVICSLSNVEDERMITYVLY